jgi:hypothetical protein
LYTKIGPALTRLGDLADVDPTSLRTPDEFQGLAQAALKRFGVLCHLPGGNCCSFQACEVQFKCAACAAFVPDPARRDEVESKIATCQRLIRVCQEDGDVIQARNLQSHLHNWERLLKEIDALTLVGHLTPPPFDEVLQDLGVDPLADKMLALVRPLPRRLGRGGTHG